VCFTSTTKGGEKSYVADPEECTNADSWPFFDRAFEKSKADENWRRKPDYPSEEKAKD
jgi:hypothetical protein